MPYSGLERDNRGDRKAWKGVHAFPAPNAFETTIGDLALIQENSHGRRAWRYYLSGQFRTDINSVAITGKCGSVLYICRYSSLERETVEGARIVDWDFEGDFEGGL
jgi:hypothetical protein